MIRQLIRLYSSLGRRLSTAFYRCSLKSLGRDTTIDKAVIIHYPEQVSIGTSCSINSGVRIQASPSSQVIIGDRVSISYGCLIITTSLDLTSIGNNRLQRQHSSADTMIEDGAWLGAKATILAGVNVGENAVVAAGALVNQDVPKGTLVAGVPARVIRVLTKEQKSASITSQANT